MSLFSFPLSWTWDCIVQQLPCWTRCLLSQHISQCWWLASQGVGASSLNAVLKTGPSNHCWWSTAQRGWLVVGSLAMSTVGFLWAMQVSKSMVLPFVPCVLEPTLTSPLCMLGSTCSASPLWELSFCFLLAITQDQEKRGVATRLLPPTSWHCRNVSLSPLLKHSGSTAGGSDGAAVSRCLVLAINFSVNHLHWQMMWLKSLPELCWWKWRAIFLMQWQSLSEQSCNEWYLVKVGGLSEEDISRSVGLLHPLLGELIEWCCALVWEVAGNHFFMLVCCSFFKIVWMSHWIWRKQCGYKESYKIYDFLLRALEAALALLMCFVHLHSLLVSH